MSLSYGKSLWSKPSWMRQSPLPVRPTVMENRHVAGDWNACILDKSKRHILEMIFTRSLLSISEFRRCEKVDYLEHTLPAVTLRIKSIISRWVLFIDDCCAFSFEVAENGTDDVLICVHFAIHLSHLLGKYHRFSLR